MIAQFPGVSGRGEREEPASTGFAAAVMRAGRVCSSGAKAKNAKAKKRRYPKEGGSAEGRDRNERHAAANGSIFAQSQRGNAKKAAFFT